MLYKGLTVIYTAMMIISNQVGRMMMNQYFKELRHSQSTNVFQSFSTNVYACTDKKDDNERIKGLNGIKMFG